MCGITGVVDLRREGRLNQSEILQKMAHKLYHRGPDQENFYHEPNLMLGFTRLSIIGLDNGTQPIYNEDQSVIMVCNGEIFNYVELKGDLVQKGHRFSTTTDVEVIVHMYEEYGTSFIDHLNGQFAFFLFDFKDQSFICARDHFGIIPLNFLELDGYFIFGSEIKSILEFPAYKREVDMTGLDQVFSFPGMVSPRTMFKGIQSLENGHFLQFKDGSLRNVEYWDVVYPEQDQAEYKLSDEEYKEQLSHLLEESIKLRLRADVPVGTYLSGGLDSSLISCEANRISNGKVKDTYSITFKERDINELEFQKAVAEYAGMNHNQIMFLYDDITTRLPNSVFHSECPVKETYNTASLALSEKVNQDGYKVILTGEGADEFFAGYVGYKFDRMREHEGLGDIARPELDVRQKLWGDPSFFYEKHQAEFSQTKRALYADTLSEEFDQFNCLNHFVIDQSKIHNRHRVHQRSYLDYKLRLTDHLITDHGDKMAMANSVEARYPFLDKNLIEFATKVPPHLKLSEDFEEKYILKQIARNRIPDQIIDREKFGFVAPGSPFLLNRNVEYINDMLSYDRIKRQGYFNPDEVERLKKEYTQDGFHINVPFDSDMLLVVITFGIFLDQFQMPVSAASHTSIV